MRKLLSILGILGVLGFGMYLWKNRGDDVIVQQFETAEQIQRRKDIKMAEKLQVITATQSGIYTIKVYRLESGENYGFDNDKIMPARSAVKVPIIMTAVKMGLDKNYDDLLMRMGKNSDNKAQDKIVNIIGVKNLNISNYLENVTTANNLVDIWRRIYLEIDVYEKYFIDSIYEDRIALGIPIGVKLIHKVGTDTNIWNDSGIVMSQKPFILVILNEGIKREEAEKMVPALTKIVWDYETSL